MHACRRGRPSWAPPERSEAPRPAAKRTGGRARGDSKHQIAARPADLHDAMRSPALHEHVAARPEHFHAERRAEAVGVVPRLAAADVRREASAASHPRSLLVFPLWTTVESPPQPM